MKQWSASLICADLFDLKRQLQYLEEYSVGYLHVDVMDGSFVPRLGMYPEVIQAIKTCCNISVEAHLMIHDPERYIPVFAQAGADIITVHLEACRHNLVYVLEKIQCYGKQAALALNPGTELMEVDYVKEYIDYLLIMGINPGILSQKIKPFILEKISKYRSMLDNCNKRMKIIIDGGVNFQNSRSLFLSGADILVGGSQTIFHPDSSLQENLLKIMELQCNHSSKLSLQPAG